MPNKAKLKGLLPCPFCGCKTVRIIKSLSGTLRAECGRCTSHGPQYKDSENNFSTYGFEAESKAKSAWNKRAKEEK